MKTKATKAIATRCEICGYGYVFPQDRKEHAAYCRKLQRARQFFGDDLVLTYHQREELKKLGRSIWQNEALPLGERVDGALMEITGWYARSLAESGYNRKFESFGKYAIKLLRSSPRLYPTEIYTELWKRYSVAS
ncbi:MAG: hypothetical protein A4E52_01450 [Pelotomaculum sp. PtaB.Bin013]|uniref:Uncharacterized protein n=1 Tax=Pelotomaculum isophthalicicum JI TaxID=947010 RepID=A0A9X4H3F8_9FIRM|nr:hypothetical protein [Pelotomaculum isophthalicicum]MDF9409061.1 hypothetical protein [Pelotomaculum isophthalicicum JI]OPX87024.1 MAG: hypothetical protein A4E52_01450 [Pelotomaculum sp. PtaB.Bin013]